MEMNQSNKIRKFLEIPSKIEFLNKIEKMVDDISEECNLSQEVYGKVLIALIEAVNNAIVHGNKMDDKKNVKIEVFFEEKEIKIVVTDEGPGFDYANVPDPTLPENIENIHGRGVFLMDHLSDEIEFHNNGSCVEMLFNIA